MVSTIPVSHGRCRNGHDLFAANSQNIFWWNSQVNFWWKFMELWKFDSAILAKILIKIVCEIVQENHGKFLLEFLILPRIELPVNFLEHLWRNEFLVDFYIFFIFFFQDLSGFFFYNFLKQYNLSRNFYLVYMLNPCRKSLKNSAIFSLSKFKLKLYKTSPSKIARDPHKNVSTVFEFYLNFKTIK